MKETGVIRRLDELGRIVIPKEIRKRLKIDNNDFIDIFTDNDSIILKKYYPMNENLNIISSFCDSIKEIYGVNIVISDKIKIMYNTLSEEYNNVDLDKELLNRIDSYLEKEISSLVKLNLTDSYIIKSDLIIYPIMLNSEKYGYLFILDKIITNRQKEIGNLILNFLKYLL